MKKITRNVKSIQANSLKVNAVKGKNGFYTVESETDSDETYNVVIIRNGEQMTGYCECTWQVYHPNTVCKHTVNAMRYAFAQEGRRVSIWNSLSAAIRQHSPIVYAEPGIFITLHKAWSKNPVGARWMTC